LNKEGYVSINNNKAKPVLAGKIAQPNVKFKTESIHVKNCHFDVVRRFAMLAEQVTILIGKRSTIKGHIIFPYASDVVM